MLLRSAIFNIAVYLNFLVQAVLFSPVLLLPERMVWPIARFWTQSTLWLHRKITGIDEEIRGRENIPSGACIIACKHQSAWETLRLIGLFPKPCFILKRELLRVPLFGWFLARVGMIGVHRGKGGSALDSMIHQARRAVAEGRQVIIFPEGTRRSPFAPPEYRYGVTRLYSELQVPCVPIALNSGLFWPRRAFVHRAGAITAWCLPPISPGLDAETFTAQLKATLEAATKELVGEALKKHPGLRKAVDYERAEM